MAIPQYRRHIKDFDLVLALISGRGYTVNELCELLKVSRRDLYYHLTFLRDYGFKLRKEGHAYYIGYDSPFLQSIASTVRFSYEDASYLYKLADAVEKGNADAIFILPNNKNIILAAEQAQNLIHEKEIIVVPSKTIPQGISALINYLPDKSVEENRALMKEAISLVKTVELTYAVRDTKIDEMTIHAGDIMGVADKGIVAVGKEIGDTAFESVEKLVEEDSELISLY